MKEFINALKPLFPVTFSLEKFVQLNFKSDAELLTMLIKIAVYLVAGIVAGVVLGLLAIIPIVGIAFGLILAVVEIYIVAGIVLTVLDFCKVLDKLN